MPDKDISEQMVDWCIAEVRYKAEKYTETGCVEALDGIFKSDGIISEDLKNDMKTAAAPLEIVPERYKDWHPGSNGQVLNLVHPCLYPLVYGQSRILPYGSVGLADVRYHPSSNALSPTLFLRYTLLFRLYFADRHVLLLIDYLERALRIHAV